MWSEDDLCPLTDKVLYSGDWASDACVVSDSGALDGHVQVTPHQHPTVDVDGDLI